MPWSTFNRQEDWWTRTSAEKWDRVRLQLNAANTGSLTTLYVNNLSAESGTEFNAGYGDYANTLDADTLSYLNGANIQRAGMVLMDFPGPSLINALIARNFRQNVFSVPVGTSRFAVGAFLEPGSDRGGMDYDSKEIPAAVARPEVCRVACFNDSARCKSFTYAKPGLESGARARCYLKNGIPVPTLNANMDSGTTQTSANMGYFSGAAELNTDRPGMEYRSFEPAEARPELCRDACRNESTTCKAFSYTRPGGTNAKPRCSLKLGIPDPVSSPWADSGINSNQ